MISSAYRHIDTLEVSDSSLNLLNTCNRKFEFRKMFLSERFDTSLAASAGIALHTGIQHYIVHGDKEQAIFEFLMQFPFKYDKGAMDVRSWQSCIHMLETAMDYWDNDLSEWEIAYINDADGKPIPAIEVPFALVVNSYPFYPNGETITVKYIGYIDAILHNMQTGDYGVFDVKTTTVDPGKKLYEFTYADQCLPYGLILETLLNQDISRGFEIYYWLQYIHPLDATNIMYSFIKSKQDIQDWIIGFMDDINNIKQGYNRGWFKRRSSACFSYQHPCTYFDLCSGRDINEISAFIKMEHLKSASNKSADPDRYIRREPWINIELQSNLFEGT